MDAHVDEDVDWTFDPADITRVGRHTHLGRTPTGETMRVLVFEDRDERDRARSRRSLARPDSRSTVIANRFPREIHDGSASVGGRTCHVIVETYLDGQDLMTATTGVAGARANWSGVVDGLVETMSALGATGSEREPATSAHAPTGTAGSVDRLSSYACRLAASPDPDRAVTEILPSSVDSAARSLAEAAMGEDDDRSLLHGDLHGANIIVSSSGDQPTLSGLIDARFDVGDPLYDVAAFTSWVLGSCPKPAAPSFLRILDVPAIRALLGSDAGRARWTLYVLERSIGRVLHAIDPSPTVAATPGRAVDPTEVARHLRVVRACLDSRRSGGLDARLPGVESILG